MNIFAAIQAGGRSSRMGQDKAWLTLDGQPLLERVLAAAQPLSQQCAIVISHATPERERYAELATRRGARLLLDQHDYCGPLGGIQTALQACQPMQGAQAAQTALILACDLPFVTSEFLAWLAERHAHARATLPTPPALTVPVDAEQRVQMLCGLYEHACLPVVEHLLTERQFRVDGISQHLPIQRLALAEYAGGTNAEQLLMNVNTLAEWQTVSR